MGVEILVALFERDLSNCSSRHHLPFLFLEWEVCSLCCRSEGLEHSLVVEFLWSKGFPGCSTHLEWW